MPNFLAKSGMLCLDKAIGNLSKEISVISTSYKTEDHGKETNY